MDLLVTTYTEELYLLVFTLWLHTKEDIRRMERTLSVNYPVLRQNNRVLLNTFAKNLCLKSQQCTLIQEARRDR